MQTHFYVAHDNEQIGPFSSEEIQAKLKSGELAITDYVYVEAKEDWLGMSEFTKEFADAQPAPPQATPEMNAEVMEIDDEEDEPFEIIPVAAEPEPTPEAKSEEPIFEFLDGQKQMSSPPPAPAEEVHELDGEDEITVVPVAEAQAPEVQAQAEEAKTEEEQPAPIPVNSTPVMQTPEPQSVKAEAAPTPNPPQAPVQPEPVATEKPPVAESKAVPNQPAASQPVDSQPVVASKSAPVKSLNLTNGEAAWSWTADKTGTFQVQFSVESSDGKLRLVNQEVTVEAGPAAQVDWQIFGEQSVDEPVEVQFYTTDQFGNRAQDYQGELTIQTPDGVSHSMKFQNGEGIFKWECQQAGSHQLKVTSELKLPSQPETTFRHGSFQTVQVETNGQPRAGEQVDFSIRAVDKYGNTVEDFNGQITIKVDGIEAQVSMNNGVSESVKTG